ncbi:paraquat-inducible protein A [Vibrio sp. SM6]|uniref:Paraquat-inducible protein A n=1 Tax=Vibrio agarilyticus TaxID=2726741 RepID=A0A7X8TPI9_9VIBR|nr:paraquat-inducible protein A [Vibrio agarilyticus]NLS12545.1 paraquat-inducible protein A [Vibrio agarilyticus]
MKNQNAPSRRYTILCQGCDLHVDVHRLQPGLKASCPRCGTELFRGGQASLSGNLALALTLLMLYVPSLFFDYIRILLFGVSISATLPDGVIALTEGGFPELAGLVAFCSIIAPIVVCLAIVTVHIALYFRLFSPFKYALNSINVLKHWVMLDVFLVSIAVSSFKLQDYADIFIGKALIGFILLQLGSIMLLSRFRVRRYWAQWHREVDYGFIAPIRHCEHCHLSQPENDVCVRCKSPLHYRMPNSIQKTWAYLLTATIAIFPANLLPISVIITNGQRLEDTIFSGVAALIKNGMHGIAMIIFFASILVPIGKILGLVYILACIHLKQHVNQQHRMKMFGIVRAIGKWSMMDLFVITIMMTLVDRGQILDFTAGHGAIAFGVVVVFTILAAESLDPRLIWDEPRSTEDKSLHER